jgi:hypothetical protein
VDSDLQGDIKGQVSKSLSSKGGKAKMADDTKEKLLVEQAQKIEALQRQLDVAHHQVRRSARRVIEYSQRVLQDLGEGDPLTKLGEFKYKFFVFVMADKSYTSASSNTYCCTKTFANFPVPITVGMTMFINPHVPLEVTAIGVCFDTGIVEIEMATDLVEVSNDAKLDEYVDEVYAARGFEIH